MTKCYDVEPEWQPPLIIGRCDCAGCHAPTAFIARGFLADGTSPTYNEACTSHAGDIAANYLRTSDSFVRATIERLPS